MRFSRIGSVTPFLVEARRGAGAAFLGSTSSAAAIGNPRNAGAAAPAIAAAPRLRKRVLREIDTATLLGGLKDPHDNSDVKVRP